MTDKYNSTISQTIANLRFPLMLGVVLIHNVLISPTEATREGMNFLSFFIELMSHKIVAPCVPLFFFFSGYLFFLKFGDKFTVSDYGIQIKKRIHTLLIPYLFWNLVVLGYFAFMHKFTPSLINSDFNNVYHFTTGELIRSFWNFPGGQPICYQFWFLRDLLLAVIISPVIFVVMKYGRYYLMILLIALYIYNPTLFPHQMMLTFFSLGAGFAIHNYDFVKISARCVKLFAPLFITLVIVASLKPEIVSNGLIVVSGAILFVYLASKQKNINNKLSESSFFMYAFHGFPILVLSRVIVGVLHPNNTIMWLGCYLVCFVTIILISIALYFTLKKFFPKFTAFITGGR